MKKILDLKLVTMQEYNLPWTYVIGNLNDRELLERFTKKNFKRQIKQNLE